MSLHRITLSSSSLVFLLAAVACGDSGGDGGGGATGSTTTAQAGSTSSAKSSTGSMTTSSTSAASNSSAASTTDAASSTVTSSSTGGGPTMPYAITISDAQSGMPVAGLNVCERGAMPANCQITDAMGVATLDIPTGVDFTIEYQGAMYRKHLLSLRAGADNTVFSLAISNGTAPLLFGLLGQTDDPTKGSIGGLITDGDSGLAGGTAALVPASGAGPFYMMGGFPSASATSTSTDGLFLLLNVNPGTPDVQANLTGTTCTPQLGVVGATANSTVVPVEAGAFTIASSFTCL